MLTRARGAFGIALLCFCQLAMGPLTVSGDEPAVDETYDERVGLEWNQPGDYFPRWTARVGAVFLQRGRLESQPFITNANSGATILSTSDFAFPVQGGLDVAALRRGDVADLDFRYFGVTNGSASISPFLIANAGANLNIPGLDPADGPVLVDRLTYGADLQSIEMNLRQNVTPNLTLLGGVRYVSFGENMFLNADLDVPVDLDVDFHFRTRNHLIGAQFGADAILWDRGGRLRIESAIKAGIYGNSATNVVQQSIQGFGPTFRLTGDRDHTAFVGDLNFTGVYLLNERWAVRAGYQLLWLAGVAVVPDQLPSVNLATGTDRVNTGGNAFFHGAMVGLERSW